MRTILALSAVLLISAQPSEAARYWCGEVKVQSGQVDVSYELIMTCTFVGSDVEGTTYDTTVSAEIGLDDNPAQITSKTVDAVVAKATTVPNSTGSLGVTIQRNRGLVPNFQRGN